jgi:hypothetical protein
VGGTLQGLQQSSAISATIRAETIRINNGEYNDEKSGTAVAIALILIWKLVNKEGLNICGDLRAFVGDLDLHGKDRLVSGSHKS